MPRVCLLRDNSEATLCLYPLSVSVSPSTGAQMLSDAILEGEAAEGEDVVGDEEGVADVIEGGDAEDHVTDGTDGEEAAEVEDCTTQGEVLCHIVDGGNGDDDDGPDGGDEES